MAGKSIRKNSKKLTKPKGKVILVLKNDKDKVRFIGKPAFAFKEVG